jgi:AraC-like DNA-binding protein
MSYVTRWRMHLAAAALRGEGATVAALADRFGYRSRPHSHARSSACEHRPVPYDGRGRSSQSPPNFSLAASRADTRRTATTDR